MKLLNPAKLSMPTKNKQVKNWLKFAQDDLKAAEISLGENIPNIVCFHSQQAVEKALKALYLKYFNTTLKTHDLKTISRKLIKGAPKFEEYSDKILYLNKFYIPTRYPDTLPGSLPEGLPNKRESEKAVEFAKEIVKYISTMSVLCLKN